MTVLELQQKMLQKIKELTRYAEFYNESKFRADRNEAKEIRAALEIMQRFLPVTSKKRNVPIHKHKESNHD